MAPRIVIFAKRPHLGEVKTRLAEGIGAVAALETYVALLRGVSERLEGQGGWSVQLAVTPDAAAESPDDWPTSTPRVAQGTGDLGDRLSRALSDARPDSPVLVVGSDVPGLDATAAVAAFAALDESDLVLGPALDGGYWAIGASRSLPDGLLDGVRWSTAETRADTLARARVHGLNVRVLDLWLEDIDTVAEWERWRASQALQDAPPSTQNREQCGWLSDTDLEAAASVGPRSNPSA